ncbi:MAG TPA: hypothetical protein VLE96_06935 [Chlamydiales bacterium]|nr:hypothetical protein [Chlamydiales bacterium]
MIKIGKKAVTMKGLETGKEKIQRICDAIRTETLEPAKQEAGELIENAHLQAEEILKKAEKKAEDLIKNAKEQIAEKEKVFQSSLQLASRQGVEVLKQKIETKLFDQTLSELVTKEMSESKFIAHIIESFMKAMVEKGIDEDFVAVIPKDVPPRTINSLLTKEILEKLQGKSVIVGDFDGGAKIQMKGKHLTIDISDSTVKELIARYIHRDFREMIYNS